MSKAICIKKSVVFPDGVDHLPPDVYLHDHQAILTAEVTLEDRATCETDQSLLQIIPYITIFDNKTKEVFVYARGTSSGEKGLVGKCSIGLGGHMEILPGEMSLSQLIVEEAMRELEEEIELKPTEELRDSLQNKLFHGNVGFMYNTRTDVDRVHLAVAFFVGVDSEEIMSKVHEKGVITKGQFMSISDIRRAVDAGTFEIEHWTRMVLQAAGYSWIN